jgi:alpha-beta hydrolase superfamily lysophospholipase
MLPAWGFEEFTIRRGWGRFADMLADAGFTCLRFDWPGSGDSLGDVETTVSFSQWKEAVVAAADLLKTNYKIEKLVLVGHGVGGLLAPHFGCALSAAAMVLMAPQNEGRTGLRELDLSAKLIGSYLKLPEQSSDDVINIAGHSIAKSLAQEIAALRLGEEHFLHDLSVLMVARAETRSAVDWPQRLRKIGFAVTEFDYAGYDEFAGYKQASIAPIRDFERVRDWLQEAVAPGDAVSGVEEAPTVQDLEGEGFRESALVFGQNDRLFGVLCRPVARPSRAAVILVNSGDTYHIGWGRMHVAFARSLARMGIASFRIDTSGIGDSQSTGKPLYYDDAQVQDILEAVRALEGLNLGPMIVGGLCSGGYASIQTALRDPRIQGIVAINPVRLAIDPEETFEQIMNAGTSSIAAYRRRILSAKLFKDVLSGRVSVLSIMSKIRQIAGARYVGFTLRNRLRTKARQQAEALSQRGVKSIHVFAEGDAGLDELARLFGKRAPADYHHAAVRIISDTEHNMTAPHARGAILQAIVDVSLGNQRDAVSKHPVPA